VSAARRARGSIVALLLAVLLASCRIDASVDVAVDEDGSGTVTLTVRADEEVVTAAPGLAQDVRVDDLRDAGWSTDGVEATGDGGVEIVLVRPFATPEEATAVLASVSGPDGPLQDVVLERAAGPGDAGDEVRFRLSGAGRVDAGLASFADPELLAVAGATPYADAVAAAGLSPNQAVGLTLRVDLPGTVEETTATDDAPLTWPIPLDGTPVELTSTSVVGEGTDVWGIAATVALVALVAWCVASVVLIALVVAARRRRRLRRLAAQRARGDAGADGHPAARA